MAQPSEKDGYDLVIDFSLGAFFAGLAGGWGYIKTGSFYAFPTHGFLLMALAWACIGGGLAALYLDLFWFLYGLYMTGGGEKFEGSPYRSSPPWANGLFGSMIIIGVILVVILILHPPEARISPPG